MKELDTISEDKYWCTEGCGFVNKDHRCEQWGGTIRIPKEALAAHDELIRLDCANRAVAWYNATDPDFDEHEDDDGYWDAKLRAAIMGAEPAREES